MTDTLVFLRVVRANPLIHKLLATRGYTNAEGERAFELLHSLVVAPPATPLTENHALEAAEEIDAWRTTGFSIVTLALARLHPEQEAFLLQGLDVSNAAAFIPTAAVFFERCKQLETGKGRKETHKADLAALAMLESRGLGKAERKRLAALVTLAETQGAPFEGDVETLDDDQQAELDARVIALRAWLLDWRNVARVVIKRRDWLLALGIGKRRAKKVAASPAPAPIPAPLPTPVPPVGSPVVAPPVLAAHIDDDAGPQSRAA